MNDLKKAQICNTVKRYFRGNGISIAAAAMRIGITERALYNRLSGRPLSAKTIKALADAFNFNPEYLRTGEGPVIQTSRLVDGFNSTAEDYSPDSTLHAPDFSSSYGSNVSLIREEFWPEFWRVLQRPATFDERDGDYLITVAKRLASDYARVLEENKILRQGLDYYIKAAKVAQDSGFKMPEENQVEAV